MIRGVLIDPFAKKISEVEITKDFRQIYKQIGADTFTCVTVMDDGEQQEVAYVDDEGLYAKDQRFFLWAGYPQPLGGKALILGCDRMGESCASKIKVFDVVSKVSWFEDLAFAGADTSVGEAEHPAFGVMTHVRSVPNFTGGDNFRMVQATDEDVLS